MGYRCGSGGDAGVIVEGGQGCSTDRCSSAHGIPGTFSFSNSGSIRLFFQQEGFLWEKERDPGENPSPKARSITAWRVGSRESGWRWLG
jgi:hypothetical protein